MVSQDDYYSRVFEKAHYRGALGAFTSLVHRKIEQAASPKDNYPRVLEIGGNRGEHFSFVKHNFEEYLCTDINVPNIKATDSRLKFLFADAQALPFASNSVDRVLNACVLHHIPNAFHALQEMRRVVNDGGLVSIYVPFDPGMVYRYVRHITSHMKQSKIGRFGIRETKELWAREHINHALGLMNNIQEVFSQDSIVERRWPIPWVSWNFNLFVVYEIKVIKAKN
jgi:phosphatidylethanolamine/phosphatidyl-N-methylethanolamine N-methyltransferase